MFAIIALITGTSIADTLPPGEAISSAISADIPPEGFDAILTLAPSLIPSAIPIEDFSASSGGFCLWGYEFAMRGMNLEIDINQASLAPKDGYMEMAIYLDVQLNNSNAPFYLDTELACIPGSCDGYVKPFPADIVAQVILEIIDLDQDGIKEMDATIQNVSYNYDLTSDDIVLDNCAISTIEDILNFLGLSMYDLILNIAQPELESVIQELIPTIETEIENAFAFAKIDQEIEIGDSAIQLTLSPSAIRMAEEGMRLSLEGATVATQPAQCVSDIQLAGSLYTEGEIQSLEEFPPGNDAGIVVKDDFINQALFSLWEAGLICTTVDDDVFALDTAILNLLTSDSYVDIFPDPQPMKIVTAPKRPPTLNMQTSADMGVSIEELGLQFYTEIDYRTAKALEMNLNADIGVNFNFDNTTGELGIDLDIDPALISGTVSDNEITPDNNDVINDNFDDQIETILNILDLNALIGDLSFSIPSANGVGVSNMNFNRSGEYEEDLGAYIDLDEVAYTGCGGEGGCSSDDSGGCGEGADSGCEGGCATGGKGQGRILFSLCMVALAFFRRRAPIQTL